MRQLRAQSNNGTEMKMVPFENLGIVFYSHSIATVALPCIISEIKRDNSRNTPPEFDAPHRGDPLVISQRDEESMMIC